MVLWTTFLVFYTNPVRALWLLIVTHLAKLKIKKQQQSSQQHDVRCITRCFENEEDKLLLWALVYDVMARCGGKVWVSVCKSLLNVLRIAFYSSSRVSVWVCLLLLLNELSCCKGCLNKLNNKHAGPSATRDTDEDWTAVDVLEHTHLLYISGIDRSHVPV